MQKVEQENKRERLLLSISNRRDETVHERGKEGSRSMERAEELKEGARRGGIFGHEDCENGFKDVSTPLPIQRALLEAQKKKEAARTDYWKKACPKEFGEPTQQKVEKSSPKKMFSIKDMVIPKRRNDFASYASPVEEEGRPRKNSF